MYNIQKLSHFGYIFWEELLHDKRFLFQLLIENICVGERSSVNIQAAKLRDSLSIKYKRY